MASERSSTPGRARRGPGIGGERLQKARGGNGQEPEKRKAGVYMDRASASTVARLSSFYRVLGEFEREHVETISSKRLAERCGITSAQVRKDLSVFGNFGRAASLHVSVCAPDRGIWIGTSLARGADRRRQPRHALFATASSRSGLPHRNIFDADPGNIGRMERIRSCRCPSSPACREPGIDIAIIAVAGGGRAAGRGRGHQGRHSCLLNFAPRQVFIPAASRCAKSIFHRHESCATRS